MRQPKGKKKPGRKPKSASAAPSSKTSEAPVKKAQKAPPAKKKDPDSFFAFGGTDESDSDSEGEVTKPSSVVPSSRSAHATKDFSLGVGGNDDDSDNEDDIPNGAMAPTWTIAQPNRSEKNDADEDDGWADAREAAAIAKVREEDKKKREEKMKAEAEQLKNQRLADAVAHGEELRAQRLAEEEEEARQKEEQEKEAEEQRRKAREEARAQAQSVEQTVDLDIQRDIMKQYEQSFMDKEMGGASPSSDFGF